MFKSLRTIFLGALLTLSMSNSYAGGGLSAAAVINLLSGDILSAAIGGGLGAWSLTSGIKKVQSGSVGWGVFLIILDDEGIEHGLSLEKLVEMEVISADEADVLSASNNGQRAAFLEVVQSDMSEEEKVAAIQEIF